MSEIPNEINLFNSELLDKINHLVNGKPKHKEKTLTPALIRRRSC